VIVAALSREREGGQLASAYNFLEGRYTMQQKTWQNWSRNLVHTLPSNSYLIPGSLSELQDIVRRAASAGVTLRVSGQRHSQAPLVAEDNRGGASATTWLVDLSCYADLGPNGTERILLETGGKEVTVNTGVREDELDAFLTRHDRMFRTVTAGGFFSIGGMTAVDVHGATVDAPIFAETASAFSIMGPDGAVTKLDKNSPAVEGWSPLQFARVSLGALGIVTSVTLEVMERPLATTLQSGRDTYTLNDENAFVAQFKTLLTTHARIETFFDPYTNRFLALWWDVEGSPSTKTPNNKAPIVPDPCALAGNDQFGAPLVPVMEGIAQQNAQLHQTDKLGPLGVSLAHTDVNTVFLAIGGQFDEAKRNNKELWLDKALRTIFMSYFVELPGLDDAGLGKIWKGLNAVTRRLQSSHRFQLVAPLEFRFVRGGNTAMAGTFTEAANSTFVNLDMIGYVPAEEASRYDGDLLQFFADIEREWVALGGMPHHGKMYGFYDSAGSVTPPFNPAFLEDLANRRSARIKAFDAYRQKRDPNGMFCNPFVHALLGYSAR
jgi:FAD/FMN-containing dehydrogenase